MTQLARRRLWSNTRFLVVDVETTRTPERGPLRIVSLAAIAVRNGQAVTRLVEDFVNPGCPIDDTSAKVHKITDAMVVGAPTFAAIARSVTTFLRPDPAERTIFVAHHAAFDAPVLRTELERVREAMPELPVLDTIALMTVAGVGGRRGLKDLCAELGIPLAAHHRASADAEATALVLAELLNRAADLGYDDLDALLGLLGGHTTRSLKFAARFRDADEPLEPELPASHLATHALILPAKPGKRILETWLAAGDECARLRCAGLVDRVAAAELPPAELLASMLPRLRTLASAGNRAEVATYLEATLPLLEHLPSAASGTTTYARRSAALALESDLGALLDPLGRCVAPVSCPACRRGEPCALDTWRLPLAGLLISSARDPSGQALGYVNVGSDHLKGAYTKLVGGRHGLIADVALRLVHRQWLSVGQRDQADRLVRQAIAVGSADPEIVEAYAAEVGKSGTQEALTSAIGICQAALAKRAGSTDEAWIVLEARLGQLRSRAARFRVRYEDERDADGNLVPKRRHHPVVPLRRPARFHPAAAA